jgi:heme/copper-type cytochrome/quinol oxidase subunit 3
MKPLPKLLLKTFLIAGLIYASLMAGYDYSIGNEFRLVRFLINTLFFGLVMLFLQRYNYKKNQK